MVLIFFKYSGSTDIDQGATALLPSTQSATTFMQMSSGGEIATAVGSFSDISTQAIYSNPVGGQSRGDSYDAPLLQMISSVPYYGGINWVSGTMGQKF